MLAVLNHPNVLRFYGVVTAGPADQTVVGIMTEFMNGSSLSNYLRSAAGLLRFTSRTVGSSFAAWYPVTAHHLLPAEPPDMNPILTDVDKLLAAGDDCFT